MNHMIGYHVILHRACIRSGACRCVRPLGPKLPPVGLCNSISLAYGIELWRATRLAHMILQHLNAMLHYTCTTPHLYIDTELYHCTLTSRSLSLALSLSLYVYIYIYTCNIDFQFVGGTKTCIILFEQKG